MVKWVVYGTLALLTAQETGQNPEMKFSPNWGISFMRPPKPKNEEWEFKDGGIKSRAEFCVSHKVDSASIEFLIQEPADNDGLLLGYYDPKHAAENLFKGFSASPKYKDGKMRGKVKAAKLPGNAASGVQAWYLEFEFKDTDGKQVEFRTWSFIGKENQCLYRILAITGEGIYAKYLKEITYILSSVKTYKIKKDKK